MSAADIRQIAEAARPTIRAMLDATEELAAIRDAATAKGIDWSQLKALLKAEEQDSRDGGTRVDRIVTKADFASSYANMLGMCDRDERETETRSSLTETLAEAKAVSAKSTTRNMAAQAKVVQAMADEGMISPEAAAETQAICAAVAQKFGEPDLEVPEFLDRRAGAR